MNDPSKWLQIDLENLYIVSEVKVLFPSVETGIYKIELSKDNISWVLLATQNQNDSDNKFQKHLVDSNSAGRFLRITFPGSENKTVAISEVEVYGKPAN
jgi:hypothetical protein